MNTPQDSSSQESSSMADSASSITSSESAAPEKPRRGRPRKTAAAPSAEPAAPENTPAPKKTRTSLKTSRTTQKSETKMTETEATLLPADPETTQVKNSRPRRTRKTEPAPETAPAVRKTPKAQASSKAGEPEAPAAPKKTGRKPRTQPAEAGETVTPKAGTSRKKTSASAAAAAGTESPAAETGTRKTAKKTAGKVKNTAKESAAPAGETIPDSPATAAAGKEASPGRTRRTKTSRASASAEVPADAVSPSLPESPETGTIPAPRAEKNSPAEVPAEPAEVAASGQTEAPARDVKTKTGKKKKASARTVYENAFFEHLHANLRTQEAAENTEISSPAPEAVSPSPTGGTSGGLSPEQGREPATLSPAGQEKRAAGSDNTSAVSDEPLTAPEAGIKTPKAGSSQRERTEGRSPEKPAEEKMKKAPGTDSPAAGTDGQEAPAGDTGEMEAEYSDTDTSEDTDFPASEEDTGQKKSRRGRRGGRSRKRKNKSPETPAQESPDELKDELKFEAPASGKAGDEDAGPEVKEQISHTRRRMFISVLPNEQVEVAITEEGIISEYYLEMQHQAKIKGNIYKGVIHNIDTNLQAAFVNYGSGKNGFLQIDEIHPEYFLAHHDPVKGKKFPPIQKVLKAGQEVLVQVVKEPNGSKGAFLTTWLSLAGRFLVLTPGQEQIGVSRKVESDEERARLRELMNGIDPGEGLGVIVRTVSAGTSKLTLKNDLQYLKRVWKDVRKRGTTQTAPCLIYQEPGLAGRAVRDYLTDDVCEIWVDHPDVAEAIRETATLLFPRKSDLVKVHTDTRQSLWERFSLQRQLEQIYSREVVLPSGGRLVFDQTEALLAIDINSGKISGKTNFEAMAHRTNMEAAEAIARQLKLRDVGGQVVIDFIEMRDKNHIRDVEKTLRLAMKNDRARHDVSRMSSFGLLELVRQRTGSSALSITMELCPHCKGTGLRRNLEWQALQALREIRRLLGASRDLKYVYTATMEVGIYLLNHKRTALQMLEEASGKTIEISIRP